MGDIQVTTGRGCTSSWSGFMYPHPSYKFSSGSGSSLLRAGRWPPLLSPLSAMASLTDVPGVLSLQAGPCSCLRCVAWEGLLN